ncbi:MAG: MotA/TolQ/ExbB proton channel family protein [Pseudomonadota bacterium]
MPSAISAYWTQVDEASHLVFYVLLMMSLTSWYTILSKAWSFWRVRSAAPTVQVFWQAPTIQDAVALLAEKDKENIFTPMAREGMGAVDAGKNAHTLNAETSLSDIVTRVLRQQMNLIVVKLEAGLSLLASIGATAPFVGLLGTVWGIYHALTTVAMSGSVQLEQIAGPVGEALIMTALGLLVAIPSVLAYNAFNRINRITLAELDAFAYDLHAHLTKTST